MDGEVLSSLRLSWLSCVCVAYLHHLDTSSQRRGRETPVALVGYTGYMQTFARPRRKIFTKQFDREMMMKMLTMLTIMMMVTIIMMLTIMMMVTIIMMVMRSPPPVDPSTSRGLP